MVRMKINRELDYSRLTLSENTGNVVVMADPTCKLMDFARQVEERIFNKLSFFGELTGIINRNMNGLHSITLTHNSKPIYMVWENDDNLLDIISHPTNALAYKQFDLDVTPIHTGVKHIDFTNP